MREHLVEMIGDFSFEVRGLSFCALRNFSWVVVVWEECGRRGIGEVVSWGCGGNGAGDAPAVEFRREV